MKKVFYLFILTFIVVCAKAQTKELTIDEAVLGKYNQFYPDFLNGLKWRNSTNYIFIDNWEKIMEGNIKNDKTTELCNLSDINKILKSLGITQLEYLYDLVWLDENTLEFQQENKVFTYNILDKKIVTNITIPETAKNIRFDNTSNSVAYTIDNNIFLNDKNSKSTQLTFETDLGIICGSDYVHRQEFGINNGIFWSPKSNYIAFYRKDETMVADYPIVDFTQSIAKDVPTKYPMTGEKSEEVTLGVYNIATAKTIYLKTGEPKEQFLTSITWDPTENFIYIGVLNRQQNYLKLNKYDAKTGDFVKTLFEEKNDKYVEPEHTLYFLKNTPNQFLWYSERDNYQHLYLYDTEGNLIKQVTKGNWIVKDILGFDNEEKNLFIYATKDSPIEQHAYKINMKTGEITKITSEAGFHTVQVTSDGKYFVDEYSSTEVPNIANLKSIDEKLNRNLLTAENPYKDYKLGEMTISTIKSADGVTDLYYRLITPPNYDKTKKYPAIIYVYGGPHAQMIENSWLGGAALWEFYMAQKGYVIYVLDNRGSENRGFEFESVIHRNCGVNEMKDQLKGVDFLKTLGFVDMDRIGVHGWSYGGFMTTSLLTTYPDIFKVGVAGGPVIDWKYYEVMYGERYMDTPQENPEGYANTSLLNKAKNLKGKLLIIHGCIDPVVVWQNSLMFIEKCIDEKVLLDYFVYPTSEHNVRGIDRVHLMRKVTEYFDDNL